MIANGYSLRRTRSSHSDSAERKRDMTHCHRVNTAATERDELRRVQSIVENSDHACDRAAHGRRKIDVDGAATAWRQVLAGAIITLRVVATGVDTSNNQVGVSSVRQCHYLSRAATADNLGSKAQGRRR